MHAFGTRLKDHFQQELGALREDAAAFARSYPAEAAALQLSRTGSNDPHVVMLLQTFAFLTGRVRYELEGAKAALPNALLSHLQPQLAAPVPSMAIAQAEVCADLLKAAELPRGRLIVARVHDQPGELKECRMRTTSASPLVPIEVADVELVSGDGLPASFGDSAIRSALRIRFRRMATVPIRSMQITRLRLFIDASLKHAHYIYDLLALGLRSVWLRTPADLGSPRPLADCDLSWRGFDDDEAALPAPSHGHPGHRLLQEYFAFAEKFMFFDLGPLDLSGVDADFELFLACDTPVDAARHLSSGMLKLNCVPLVNLFSQRIDPLLLDQSRYEYLLRADVQADSHCEIHSLEELVAIKPDGSLRKLSPYFGMERVSSAGSDAFYYLLRHEPSRRGEVAGTDALVSFLDLSQRQALPPEQVIGGRALCTNRRLAERMRDGQALLLEGPGPVRRLTLVGATSQLATPALSGEQPWALMSQLSLNHLSLAQGEQALAAFKRALMAHLGPTGAHGMRQVDGLTALACRPTLRHHFDATSNQRSFVHGLYVTITLDRSQFEHCSALLFASVLRRFLALYASVNAVIEVEARILDRNRSVKVWQPMSGAQIVL